MSYNPQIFASALHFDSPNGGGGGGNSGGGSGGGGRGSSFSGVHPGMFQPPSSPSVSSSMFFGRSSTSLQSDAYQHQHMPNAKRKRPNQKESTPFSDWSTTADGTYNTDNIIADRSEFDLRTNGQGRQYVLSGQVETPNGMAREGFGYIEDSVYSDVDYRRALGSKRSPGAGHSPTSTSVTAETAEPATQRSTGWGFLAISTLGGVVGKVWEFCKTGAFRGFYAGGGQGYELPEAKPRPEREADAKAEQAMDDQAMHDQTNVAPAGLEPSLVPLRASFPQADYSSNSYDPEPPESPESTPPPAAKRRQLWNGSSNDELQKNWVVIEQQPANAIRQPAASALRRPVPRPGPTLARRINKPVSRLNTPVFNRFPPTRSAPASAGPLPSRAPASFASTRSPGASSPVQQPVYTPSRIPVPSSSQPQTPSRFATPSSFIPQPSQIPSPSPFAKRTHRRNQSTNSTPSIGQVAKLNRRESLHEVVHDNSPRLDAQARSLAAKRRKDELEADLRINDFNARLQDMIRQGKEALGTTFEVELYDEGTKEEMWESDNDELC